MKTKIPIQIVSGKKKIANEMIFFLVKWFFTFYLYMYVKLMGIYVEEKKTEQTIKWWLADQKKEKYQINITCTITGSKNEDE